MPSREIFWNIQFGELVYLFGALLIVAVIYGLYRRLRLWRMGSEDDRLRISPAASARSSSRRRPTAYGTNASSAIVTRA